MIIRLLKVASGFAMLFFASATQAGLYRCTMPDGNTAYTDRPCSTGKQAVISDDRTPQEKSKKAGEELWKQCEKLPKDTSERAECVARHSCYVVTGGKLDAVNSCVARSAEDALKKKNAFDETNKEITKRLSALSACFHKEDRCQAADYQRNLKCLPPVYAEELFGSASNAQSVGGQELFYYNVPIHNGTSFATKRLQLVVGGYCYELPLPGSVRRISEINVW